LIKGQVVTEAVLVDNVEYVRVYFRIHLFCPSVLVPRILVLNKSY